MSVFPQLLVIVSNIKFLAESTQWDPMGPQGSLPKLHCFQNSPSSCCWLRMLCKPYFANVCQWPSTFQSPVPHPSPGYLEGGEHHFLWPRHRSLLPTSPAPSSFSLDSSSQSPSLDPPHSPMSKGLKGHLVHWDRFARWVISSSPVALNANLMLMTLKFLLPT